MEGKEWERKWGKTERKKEEQEAELEKYTEESGNPRLWLGLARCPAGSLSAVSDLAFMPETAGGVNSQPSPEAKLGDVCAHKPSSCHNTDDAHPSRQELHVKVVASSVYEPTTLTSIYWAGPDESYGKNPQVPVLQEKSWMDKVRLRGENANPPGLLQFLRVLHELRLLQTVKLLSKAAFENWTLLHL